MIPLAAFLIAALAGVAAGRLAGHRGWLLVPLVPALAAAASLVTEGYVEPLLLAVSVAWALVAAVGVLVGLARRRRARPAV